MMLYTSWRSFGHILVTVTIESQKEQALLTVVGKSCKHRKNMVGATGIEPVTPAV